MQQQRLADVLSFAQQIVETDAVVADRGIAVGAGGAEKGEPPTQAIADHADLGAAARPQGGDAGGQVFDAFVCIEFLQQVEPFLELIENIGIQFHTGLQPPEQVGGDDRIAVCRPGIGHGADVLVDAQDFLNDHDTRLGLARWHGEIGFHAARSIRRGNVAIAVHGISTRHTPFNNTSRSNEERCPRSCPFAFRKASAEKRPWSRSMLRKSHSALTFEEEPSSVKASLATRWIRIPAHSAPSQSPGFAICRSRAIIRNSFSRTLLKETSLRRFRMSRAVRGLSGRSTGLIWTRIVSLEVHSRTRGVIVGLPE